MPVLASNLYPNQIPNLQQWLKADAVTGLTDNQSLPTWTDQSGQGNNAFQTVALNQPKYKTNIINGLPAIKFNGATVQYYNGSTNLAILNNKSGATVFIAYAKTGSTGQLEGVYFIENNADQAVRFAFIVDAALNNTAGVGTYLDFRTRRLDAETGVQTEIDNQTTTSRIVTCVANYSANTRSLYTEGNLVANNINNPNSSGGNTSATNSFAFLIGAAGAIGNSPFSGYIYEIIFYDRALSDYERKNIEFYLKNKYQL